MTSKKRAAYKAVVDKVVERCLRSPRSNWSLFDCVVEEVHGGGPSPTQEQLKIIESAVHKNKGRPHHATKAAEPDTQAATELELYIVNEADLHRQHVEIQKNLATKKVRSQYKHDLAVKAFGYLVESGAKKYAKEFGSPDQPWHRMFDVPTRKLVAEELTKGFEAEFELGNYDYLLPKKYQKEFAKQHLVPPHRHHARKSARSAVGGARKKVSWKAPESLKIVWSPVNSAWFALWPGRGRAQDQQVLKIAGTDDMHSWLRETYGDPYGRVGGRSHSTVATSTRKRSPGQLDREIAEVVPSWRRGR